MTPYKHYSLYSRTIIRSTNQRPRFDKSIDRESGAGPFDINETGEESVWQEALLLDVGFALSCSLIACSGAYPLG